METVGKGTFQFDQKTADSTNIRSRQGFLETNVALFMRMCIALRIYGIVQTNVMIFLAVLSATLVGIGLFEPGQQEFASVGGLAIACLAASFFMQTYFRMKSLKNLDIGTELVRARLLELSSLYPEDEILQHVRTTIDKLYPKAPIYPPIVMNC